MFPFEEIANALIVGNAGKVEELTKTAIAQGVELKALIDKAFMPGMDTVSEKFRNNEYYVPQVLFAARAMQTGLDLIKPLLTGQENVYHGKVVVGTSRGDMHDIGKNIVAMMLAGAGFEVIDLGTDISPQRFVQAVKDESPQLIGISSLMTTTMPAMKETIDHLKNAGLRDKVKVIIGGAPVTQDFAMEIGADGYAPDGAKGIDLAKELIGKK
ncbi:MAG: corrinoid protein [Candidatus Tectomicrobia bacterium]|uniref:Corrinoid protein n=1 Tax=Tectimicrobiota bacterium TaxID=2528274 RepID=A0A933GLA8_UNCTE|nr:corrinoid protein [Candidatus Tectomicrobia bacterium]